MKPQHIFGIDEVGRGPLAGPVTICAVKISAKKYSSMLRNKSFAGLKDSKKLSAEKRELWLNKINIWRKEKVLEYEIVSSSANLIDKKGISVCIYGNIDKALKKLDCATTDKVLLDGALKVDKQYKLAKTIIKGDEKIPLISLASIVAKVHRDTIMYNFAKKFPQYSFHKNVGYGTRDHMKAIRKFGITEIHRKTFTHIK